MCSGSDSERVPLAVPLPPTMFCLHWALLSLTSVFRQSPVSKQAVFALCFRSSFKVALSFWSNVPAPFLSPFPPRLVSRSSIL